MSQSPLGQKINNQGVGLHLVTHTGLGEFHLIFYAGEPRQDISMVCLTVVVMAAFSEDRGCGS